MFLLFLKFFFLFFLDDFQDLSFGILLVSLNEFISFGLFVELKDGGDFGLEVLKERRKDLGTGRRECLVVLMGLTVGLFD